MRRGWPRADPGALRRVGAALVVAATLAASATSIGATRSASDDARDGSPARSRLQGTALDGPRRGVAGVQVLVRPEGRSGPIWLTATDRDGRFKLEGLSDGEYRVDFYRDGYEAISKERVQVRFPFRAVVEQPLTRNARERTRWIPAGPPPASDGDDADVSGTVLGPDGEPRPEVRVRWVRADGTRDPRTLSTDDEGRFVADGLAPGDWRLEVNGLGFLPLRAPVRIGGDRVSVTVALTAQPPDYTPTALDLLPTEEPTIPRWARERPPLPDRDAEATAGADRSPADTGTDAPSDGGGAGENGRR